MRQIYSDSTISAFRQIATASVSDALEGLKGRGYLSSGIRRITGTSVVGPAVTVREVPSYDAVPPELAIAAVETSAPGSVIVIANNAMPEVAVWGGLMTAGAVANGLEGMVTDASVRDVREIERDFAGFTTFAQGSIPATTVGHCRTVSAGEPVAVGGVTICSGDLVVGDLDGVVVVPKDVVADVLERAQEIEARERDQTRLILESGSILTGLAKHDRI